MQLDQIVIKPAQKKWIIQYSDALRRPGQLILDATNNASVNALVTQATAQLPTPATRSDKPQIQAEIAQLEDRLTALKQSIGQA